MSLKFCKCPYIPCPVRGNCEACMSKHQNGPLPHCMEKVAQEMGAELPLRFPKTELVKDYEEMSCRTAERVKETLEAKPDALLCFPAGSTVIRTCEILVEMAKNKEIDFSRARFVALDEWVGLEDTAENCTAFLTRHLYEPLNIRSDNLTLFDPRAKDLDAECKRVDEYIFSLGGIDLMILGIGMNGHLGLNEPGDSFDSYAKVVTLSKTTKSVGQKYFSGPTELTQGITLGIKHVFETKTVVLQVSGEAKKDIIYRMYHEQPTQDIPATVMTLLKDGLVIIDEAAASRIKDIL